MRRNRNQNWFGYWTYSRVRSELGRVRSRTSFCWMTSNPSFRVL